MKLRSSLSDQNVFLTYICTVNDGHPRQDKLYTDSKTNYNLFEDPAAQDIIEDHHIKVEKSKALHELVDAHERELVIVPTHKNIEVISENPSTSDDSTKEIQQEREATENYTKNECNDNPKILKLTKMKWLTEDRDGFPDSRSPSLSPSSSSFSITTQSSKESNTNMQQFDKHLSTILRLDKEHNMFGLSNIAIVGSGTSRKSNRKHKKPAFPQTTIVQICCAKKCCKNKSNTDLPAILKCSSCRSTCCYPEYMICPTCVPSYCSTCPQDVCSCKEKCPPSNCKVDNSSYFGLSLTLKRKPKFEPTYSEITPRSNCIQSIPLMVRRCTHTPHCVPPSSWFPYLMPCYWPAREGAPCTEPAHCFHNPPCPPARKPRNQVPDCARPKCNHKNAKCETLTCPGQIKEFKTEIEKRFGVKERKSSLLSANKT